MPLDTLRGDFEISEEDNLENEETPKEELEDKEETPDIEEKEEEDPKPKKEKEDKEEPDPEGEGDKDKKEDKKKEEEEDNDEDETTKLYEDIASSLEEEELIFLEDDKEYEATPEGFKQMMEDNILAYKDKMEKEFKERETQIRKSYEESNKPKIADMDPSDESQALEMLEKYYQETGFTEDEIKDKIEEVKELENLEKEAKVAKRFLGKKEEEANKKEEQRKAQEEEQKAQQVQEYIDGLKSEIDSMDEMAGFKLNNKVKRDFKNYLFKTDKEGLTPAQRAGKDPDRRLRLAFLDFMDFNKKDFEIKAKTELANEYSKKVSRFTSKQAKAKGKTVKKDNELESDNGLKPGFLDFWSAEK